MRSCTQCLSPYTQDVEFCGIDGTRLIETEADPLVGNDIDRYRILQHIGDGGMARVYRARHHVLDREVAVKVLFGEFASNKTIAERFRREAQTISRIEHENIVGVTDFGRTPQGLTFLAMELVRGQTIRRMVKSRGPLEPAFVARVTRQIALGLSAAHDLGFVHRDLKPGNVMVVGDAPDEQVKILDFGLARMADEDNEMYLTRTGQFLGTPIYMAPEQIVGADVDLRADLYSLGVMMFEMLEGHPPFTGTKLAQIREKHLSERPGRVRPAAGLEDVVAVLLAKKADERPQTARAVVASLDALTGDAGSTDVHLVAEPLDAAATQRMPFPSNASPPVVVVAPDGATDPSILPPDLGAAAVQPAQEGPTTLHPPPAHDEGPTKEIGHGPAAEVDTDEQSAAAAEVIAQIAADHAAVVRVTAPRALDPRTRSGIDEDPNEIVTGSHDDWEDGPTVAAASGVVPTSANPTRHVPVEPTVTDLDAAPSELRRGRRTFAVALVTAAVAVATGLVVARAINGAPAERPPVAASVEPDSDTDARGSEPDTAPEAEAPLDDAPADGVAESTAAVEPPTRRKSAPKKRRVDRRAAKRRFADRVDAALSARGLMRSDLSTWDGTAQAYERWRGARRRDDPQAWQKTTQALVDAVQGYPVRPGVLDRRLKRIAARLQTAAERVPTSTLRPLEDRYLAIASEARPSMTDPQLVRALERANALLVSVNATLERHPR